MNTFHEAQAATIARYRIDDHRRAADGRRAVREARAAARGRRTRTETAPIVVPRPRFAVWFAQRTW